MNKEKLKEARQKLGLSISEMSRRLKTPRSTYIKWERGENKMPGIVEVALKTIVRGKT